MPCGRPERGSCCRPARESPGAWLPALETALKAAGADLDARPVKARHELPSEDLAIADKPAAWLLEQAQAQKREDR